MRYAPALYNLARINHQWLRNDSQAESLFEEFLRLEPEGAPAESASRALAAIRATGAAARTKPDDASPDPGAGGTTSAEPPGPKAFVPVLVDDRLRVAELLAARGRGEAAVNNYLLAAREADRTRRPTLRDRALRAAEELCGENPRAHYELGLYWIEAAQPEKALGRFKQAAALSNTWYEAHIALARLAASGGEYDAAVVAARQADRAQPDRPEALWILAQLYDRRLELSEQAAACYREFVKRFDGDARSDEARARLQALGVDAPPAPAAGKPSRGLWPSLFRGRDRNNGAD